MPRTVQAALHENRRHGDPLFPVGAYFYDMAEEGNVLPCHWHEEFEFLQIFRGRAQFQIGRESFDAAEGELLFILPGELHAGQCGPAGCCYRAVVFHGDWLSGQSGDAVQLDGIGPLLGGSLSVPRLIAGASPPERELLSRFEQLYDMMERRPSRYKLAVKGLVLLALFFLLECAAPGCGTALPSKPRDASGELIKDSLLYMQEHYRENVTVGMLAERCAVSQGHFCRLFKRQTMKTPIQYLNDIRLARAAEALLSTEGKILDIALDSGFNSLSYFINVFSERFGCTPSAYRRNR